MSSPTDILGSLRCRVILIDRWRACGREHIPIRDCIPLPTSNEHIQDAGMGRGGSTNEGMTQAIIAERPPNFEDASGGYHACGFSVVLSAKTVADRENEGRRRMSRT